MTSSSGRYRRQCSDTAGGGGGGVSTLKRLLSDLLQTLQIHDSWRRPRRSNCNNGQADVTAPNKSTPTYHGRCVSLNDVYERDVETPSTLATPLPPTPRLPIATNASNDVEDDVTASARSSSPSSEVENILESLRDSTTTYYGDFTLRRVFSLEEELATCSSASDSTDHNNQITSPTDVNRGENDNHPYLVQTAWTLPLIRRSSASAVDKSLTNAFCQINGFTQVRTSHGDDYCPRLQRKSDARVILQSPGCPGNVVEYPFVKASPQDCVSVEKDSVLPLQTDNNGRMNTDALTGTKIDEEFVNPQIDTVNTVYNITAQAPDTSIKLATADCDILSYYINDDSKRSIEREYTENLPVSDHTSQVQSPIPSLSPAAVPEPIPEQSGAQGSTSEVINGSPCVTATDYLSRNVMVVAKTKFQPVQRSSSNREPKSRPPVQPRSSSPAHTDCHKRRSSTPSRLPAAIGLTTVGVSRTSSCEVLVDDDASQRLNDVVSRRGGVSLSRRSSLTSSAADDASETDSLALEASCDDDNAEDQLTNSLLDHLLMRLHCPVPPDDASEPHYFTQTSVYSSFDDDDEVDLSNSAVDTTVQHTTAGLPWITHKHNSLLSSLDDISTDSDIELGSSLSQLLEEKSTHHPYVFRDRLPAQAASIADLPRHTDDRLDKYWVDNCNYIPPRETPGIAVNSETASSAADTGLAAPITESQPAEVHVARTSRIPKY